MSPLHIDRDSCGRVNRSDFFLQKFSLTPSALIRPSPSSRHSAGEDGKLMKSPACAMPVVKHFP